MSNAEVAYLPGGRRANADKFPGYEVRKLTHAERLQRIKERDDEIDCWPVQRRCLHIGEWESFIPGRRRANPWDGLLRRPEA